MAGLTFLRNFSFEDAPILLAVLGLLAEPDVESADLLSCRIVVAAGATGSVGAVVIAAEVVVAAIAAVAVAVADAPSSRR